MVSLVHTSRGHRSSPLAMGISLIEIFKAKVRRVMNVGELTLASASLRRKQLLAEVGLVFKIDRADIDESPINGEKAEDYVLRLSEEKARLVVPRHQDGVILAADTTVVLGGDILGKPESEEHGVEMLRRLSANTHKVLTGVCVINRYRQESFLTSSRVVFKEISLPEILWYWNTGEPEDKAGAYGLQGKGAAFVTAIYGSFTNVIGLPLVETLSLLEDFGVNAMRVDAHEVMDTQSR